MPYFIIKNQWLTSKDFNLKIIWSNLCGEKNHLLKMSKMGCTYVVTMCTMFSSRLWSSKFFGSWTSHYYLLKMSKTGCTYVVKICAIFSCRLWISKFLGFQPCHHSFKISKIGWTYVVKMCATFSCRLLSPKNGKRLEIWIIMIVE